MWTREAIHKRTSTGKFSEISDDNVDKNPKCIKYEKRSRYSFTYWNLIYARYVFITYVIKCSRYRDKTVIVGRFSCFGIVTYRRVVNSINVPIWGTPNRYCYNYLLCGVQISYKRITRFKQSDPCAYKKIAQIRHVICDAGTYVSNDNLNNKKKLNLRALFSGVPVGSRNAYTILALITLPLLRGYFLLSST